MADTVHTGDCDTSINRKDDETLGQKDTKALGHLSLYTPWSPRCKRGNIVTCAQVSFSDATVDQ